jgi:hypothetical protein
MIICLFSQAALLIEQALGFGAAALSIARGSIIFLASRFSRFCRACRRLPRCFIISKINRR